MYKKSYLNILNIEMVNVGRKSNYTGEDYGGIAIGLLRIQVTLLVNKKYRWSAIFPYYNLFYKIRKDSRGKVS